mmetsp:Transcript_5323/g.11744  ORF Transcript_5323/g.11744 Transcript_5323/m.11744 type:complete len:213 (-) Transcript_5323:408-1046(-)
MKCTHSRNTNPQNEKKHNRQLHDIPRNVPVHQEQIRRSNQGQCRCGDGKSCAFPVQPVVSNGRYRCEYQDYGSEGEIFEVFDSGGCVSEVVGRDSDGPFHGGEEAAPCSKPAVGTVNERRLKRNNSRPNTPPKQQNHAPNLLHAMPLAPITRRHQIPLQKPRNQKLQSLQNQTNPQTHARHAQSVLHPHALDDVALGIQVLGIVPKSDDGEE